MEGASPLPREGRRAIESPRPDVPYRELADWCVRVLREDAERRAKEEKAS